MRLDAKTPDVLVVGLGPAGSRTAAAAAAAGLDVVAIERRKEAGAPVQCAEFVPAMIEREVTGLAAVTAQPVTRMLTFTEGEPPEEMVDFAGWMIDRAGFDRMIAEEAAARGAACFYGTSLRRIETSGVFHLSNGDAYRPRIVVGADGPCSRIGAAIGQINDQLVDTRQLTVPLARAHDATDIFLRADYRGGYGWLFPKGAVANLGIGVSVAERRRLKPLLAALHAELAAGGRIGRAPSRLTGGFIPVGGRLRCTGTIGGAAVLLAGDAAGLTNPVTGAGIAAAVQSGTLAGRAAAAWLGGDARALDDYEEELADVFDAALSRARRRRAEVLAHYANGGQPDTPALRAGWIASPHYWAA
jgi:geranylgeranyl reductase family protein